ncbi:unnamed protein product [Symbiodinium microadriaticum]|nr:unnamed protein product [Symbiodinium microadriaticum]
MNRLRSTWKSILPDSTRFASGGGNGMKQLEKCESFFSSKMASFLSEPGQKCLVEDEENLDPRSAERAMVMESQAFWQEHDQPNQKGHATNNGEGRSSWAFAPQFLLTGSAQVPPGGLAGLAGTFSAPVGTGQLAGSLQAPVSGALHGSLRVPLSSPHILLSSPGPAVREINPAADAEEDMRQRIQSSVRRIVTSAQVNATTHPETGAAPLGLPAHTVASAVTRAPSPSPKKENDRKAASPDGKDADAEVEVNKSTVVESKARQSTGERTWRAEIQVPKSGAVHNHDGKTRTMCIRGPLRVDRDQAYRDADDLQKCAQDNPGDTSKVKAMARDMLNSTLPSASGIQQLVPRQSVNKTLRFASAAAPPTMSTHHPQDARSMSTDIAPGGGQHMAKQIPQGFVRGRQLSPVRMYANRDGSPVLVYRTGMMKPRVSLPGQQPSTSLPL